jgi:hypothetical protein
MKATINRLDYPSYRIPTLEEFIPGFEYEYLNISLSEHVYNLKGCKMLTFKILYKYENSVIVQTDVYGGVDKSIIELHHTITIEHWRKGIVGTGFGILKEEHLKEMLKKNKIITSNELETINQKSVKMSRDANFKNNDIKGRVLSFLDNIYKNDIADMLENDSNFHVDILLEQNKENARKMLKHNFPTLSWKDVKLIINQLWSVSFRRDAKGEKVKITLSKKSKNKIVYENYIGNKLPNTKYSFYILIANTYITETIYGISYQNALNKLYKKHSIKYKDPSLRICWCYKFINIQGNEQPVLIQGRNSEGVLSTKVSEKWKNRYNNPDYTTTILFKTKNKEELIDKGSIKWYIKQRNKKDKIRRKNKRTAKACNFNLNNKSISNVSLPDKKICVIHKDTNEIMRIWKSEYNSFDQELWKHTSKSAWKKQIQNSYKNDPETSLHENREISIIPSRETIEVVPVVKYKWIRGIKSVCKKSIKATKVKIVRLCTGHLQDLNNRILIKNERSKINEKHKTYRKIKKEILKRSNINRTSINKRRKFKHSRNFVEKLHKKTTSNDYSSTT